MRKDLIEYNEGSSFTCYTFFYRQPGCLDVRPQIWPKPKQQAKQLEALKLPCTFFQLLPYRQPNLKNKSLRRFSCYHLILLKHNTYNANVLGHFLFTEWQALNDLENCILNSLKPYFQLPYLSNLRHEISIVLSNSRPDPKTLVAYKKTCIALCFEKLVNVKLQNTNK